MHYVHAHETPQPSTTTVPESDTISHVTVHGEVITPGATTKTLTNATSGLPLRSIFSSTLVPVAVPATRGDIRAAHLPREDVRNALRDPYKASSTDAGEVVPPDPTVEQHGASVDPCALQAGVGSETPQSAAPEAADTHAPIDDSSW